VRVYICPKAHKALKDISKSHKKEDLATKIKESVSEASNFISQKPPSEYPSWIILLGKSGEWSLYKIRVAISGKGKSRGLRVYLACKNDLTLLLIFHLKSKREQYTMKEILEFLKNCLVSIGKT